MPRKPAVAYLLITAAGVLPLLSALAGWDWYLDGPPVIVLAVAGGYAAGAWLPPVRAAACVLAAAAGLVTANQVHGVEFHWLDDAVFFLVAVGGPAGAGAAVAARARQVRHLDRLREELDQQQRLEVATARLEEQTRIQHEVHALLAERIAGIAIRAQGAQRSPDLVAFADLECEARGVLDQLRAALGSLGPESAAPDPLDRAEADVTQPATRPAPAPGPSPLDVALAVALGAALAVETAVASGARGPLWANVIGAMVVAAPLVARRTRPILAIGSSTAAGIVMSAWLTPIPTTVTGVALLAIVFYSVGAWCRRHSWVVGALVAATGVVAMALVSGPARDGAGGGAVWIVLAWSLAALGVGRITAGAQERLGRTQALLSALAQGRGAALRLATARERQALASELHDTVAHAMTVVCLQAGAYRRSGGDAVAAVQTIAATAATSLVELRRGLDSIEAGERPLERLRIVALGRRVGVDVSVTEPVSALTGPAAALAFRVVREALVNIARHAPGATAQVSLSRVDGSVVLEVLDTGGAAGSLVGGGTGRGLSGLAAALASAGGRLEWGPRTTGGFRVAATIPRTSG